MDNKFINREILDHTLKPLGFESILAENGKEEVEQCYSHHPDLVIADGTMSITDGFEMIEAIRANDLICSIKILASSTSVALTDQQKALTVGSNEFLSKPFHMPELLEMIARQLTLEWIFPASQQEQNKVESVPNSSPSSVPGQARSKQLPRFVK